MGRSHGYPWNIVIQRPKKKRTIHLSVTVLLKRKVKLHACLSEKKKCTDHAMDYAQCTDSED
jgi:hypothetical protein